MVGTGQHRLWFRTVLLHNRAHYILDQRESSPCLDRLNTDLQYQTWYTGYLPINTQDAGDRFATGYDVYAILDSAGNINETAYHEYSPIYVSATLNMTYTVAYALTTAMLVHTALWHGPRIWRGFRKQQVEAPDIHAKLMSVYPRVPHWWYGCIFVVLFALSIVCIQVFDTNLPVWAFIVALLLPIVYFLPAAFIYASTAQIMTLNLIAQLVPGFMIEGRPVAVMVSTFAAFRRS